MISRDIPLQQTNFRNKIRVHYEEPLPHSRKGSLAPWSQALSKSQQPNQSLYYENQVVHKQFLEN